MLTGTANLDTLATRAPQMPRLDTEPLTCAQAEVLQVVYEIATPHREAMLPPALHPTDPPLVSWLLYRCPESPWGPFALAQTRIECRSGLRLRAFLLSAVVDNGAAAAALGARWGFTVQPGHVKLERRYDSARATVVVDRRVVWDVQVTDPDPLSAGDVQYAANMHVAHTPRGLRLVQVEPRYHIHRVERGRPRAVRFDGAAWGDVRVEPVYPVSASLAVADVTIPRIRFLCRPDVLAFDGTESAD